MKKEKVIKKMICIRIHPEILNDGYKLANIKHQTLTQIIENGIEMQCESFREIINVAKLKK